MYNNKRNYVLHFFLNCCNIHENSCNLFTRNVLKLWDWILKIVSYIISHEMSARYWNFPQCTHSYAIMFSVWLQNVFIHIDIGTVFKEKFMNMNYSWTKKKVFFNKRGYKKCIIIYYMHTYYIPTLVTTIFLYYSISNS